MTVDQNGMAAPSLFVVRPNHRMPRGGTEFGGQTDFGQFFHQPMPALSYLFRVLIVGRDAGKAEELIKIFEMTCAHGWTVATQKRLSSQGASPPLAVTLCEGGRDSRGKTFKSNGRDPYPESLTVDRTLFEPVRAMTIERPFAFARDDSSASMNTWSYRSVPLSFVCS